MLQPFLAYCCQHAVSSPGWARVSLDPRKQFHFFFPLLCESFHMCPSQNCRSLRDLSGVFSVVFRKRSYGNIHFILKLMWKKNGWGCCSNKGLINTGETLCWPGKIMFIAVTQNSKGDGSQNRNQNWDRGRRLAVTGWSERAWLGRCHSSRQHEQKPNLN